MENKFKSTIWREFWKKQDLSEDVELIDMVVKEAIGKLPFNKIMPSDRMKIKEIDINFCKGTTIKFNNVSNARQINGNKDLSMLRIFINVEIIQVTYENKTNSMHSNDKFILEDDLQKTNLFEHFWRLKKIILIESCHDGERKIEHVK